MYWTPWLTELGRGPPAHGAGAVMVNRLARAGIKVATVRRVAAFVICAFAWFPTASEAAIGPRPCDIYASGGTPCVAAHSTTRALFGATTAALPAAARE